MERNGRKNGILLPWLRAVAFFAVTLSSLTALPFYPAALKLPLALAAAALGFAAPAIGVLAFVVALALPLAAGDIVAGVAFLIIGLASVEYLGRRGARAFLVVGLAFLAAAVNAQWALAALAGYVFGAADGALAAFIAVVALEVAGVLLGKPVLGVVATGGGKALVDVAKLKTLAAPLSFGWLSPALSHVDPAATGRVFAAARNLPLLLVQPFVWAGAATLVGSLGKAGTKVRALAVAVVGTAVAGAASIAVSGALGGPVKAGSAATAVVASAVVAAAFVALAEWVFPLLPKAEAGLPSMRAEDAEVDELLRMIANAEEALEDRHSMDAAVLITDMKSFSRLTQEQGTVATAKMIQRHRDLLLPIVTSCGGHGKSTGGDGLVAAFHATEDALTAAVKMQQALRDYNTRKPEDKRIHVRIGVAAGDVIVDRAGCPFIGDALNLAARVMGLADGGQVFAAADVVDAAADLPSPVVPHGEFALKNITRPIGIFEVLWDEGQEPRRPETEPPAAA